MEKAKILKKIDLKATLKAMTAPSVLRLGLRQAKYTTVYMAVRALPNADEYVVTYDSDTLSTIVRRLQP